MAEAASIYRRRRLVLEGRKSLQREGAMLKIVSTDVQHRTLWLRSWRRLSAGVRLFFYLLPPRRKARGADLMREVSCPGFSWHLFSVPAVWVAWLRCVPVAVNSLGGAAAPNFLQSTRWVRLTTVQATCLTLPPGLFVEAFALVQAQWLGVRLVLEGSRREEFAQRLLIQKLGRNDSMRCSGRLSRKELADKLRRSRVALNPSLVDHTPNTMIVSLANCMPVISSCEGTRYMVEDGSKALPVSAGEPETMAQALRRQLTRSLLGEWPRCTGMQFAAGGSRAGAVPASAAVHRSARGGSPVCA